MKKVTLLIISLFATLLLVAQGSVPQMEILDQVAAKTEKYVGLKIDFTLYVENLHNAKRDSYKGNAIYKTGLYKMDIMGQVVYSDGKTNWTYLRDAEEISITNNGDNEAFMTNPQAILKDYKSKFKVNFISDKFEKNRALLEFDFFPKQIENKKYSKITIRIDKTKKQIFSVRYVGKDPAKMAISLFLAEFLYHALRGEQQPDEQLFDYMKHSFLWLDAAHDGYANFHLSFLMHLSRFLGFYPNLESGRLGVSSSGRLDDKPQTLNLKPQSFFDLRESCFCEAPPLHADFLHPEEAARIHDMMRMDYQNMHLFRMSRTDRNRCLDVMLTYYRLHLPSFPELKSLPVLKELFD